MIKHPILFQNLYGNTIPLLLGGLFDNNVTFARPRAPTPSKLQI